MKKNKSSVVFQRPDEVRKNNDLIRSQGMTALQRKSFAIILRNTIEQYKENNSWKRWYEISLSDYKKVMSHEKSMPTKYIRNELEELTKIAFKWGNDKHGNYTNISIALAGFEIRDGVFRWELSSFLEDKILQDGYTLLKLSVILAMKGKYSIALYELLLQWKIRKWVEFTIDEFRILMGVNNEYKTMSNFKKKVLIPAIEEINLKSNIKIIGYKNLKKGAKIVGFRFDFKELTEQEMKERDKREILKEKYLKHYKKDIGREFKIDKKVYSLKKEGLICRGVILYDFIDSIEFLANLKKSGLLVDIQK
jgi:plasmid replication initiation protein